MTTARSVQPNIFKPEKALRSYTLEEYLHREEHTIDKHEFYNGQIIKMANSKFYHNLIGSNTVYIIKKAFESSQNDNYMVLGDSQKVYIEAENAAVYPDAIVICEKPEFYKGMESMIVNPLVVIEILSKSTVKYDQTDKFSLYKLLPSFKEYVLIDSRKPAVETRFQVEKDLWRFTNYTDSNSLIQLQSIGISISMEDIYKKVEFPVKK
jgi:Uma2 family endonuclease